MPPDRKPPRDPKRRGSRDRVEYVPEGLAWLEDQFDESEAPDAPPERPRATQRPEPEDASWRPRPRTGSGPGAPGERTPARSEEDHPGDATAPIPAIDERPTIRRAPRAPGIGGPPPSPAAAPEGAA
ncbi:MAG TPA: hypothetical protein VGC06_01790, partial [Actinomycetes bacterium]